MNQWNVKPNEYLVSEINNTFIVQGDGNAVVYRGSGPSDNHGAIWASGTNGKNNITLIFKKTII